MSDLLIQNVRVLQPGEGVVGDSLRVVGGKIEAIGCNDGGSGGDAEVVNGDGRLLTPGLIDIHTHGLQRFLYEAGWMRLPKR